MKECEDPPIVCRARFVHAGQGMVSTDLTRREYTCAIPGSRRECRQCLLSLCPSMTASYAMQYIVARNTIGNQTRRTFTAERRTHWR